MKKVNVTLSIIATIFMLVCTSLRAADSQIPGNIWTAAGKGDLEAIKKHLKSGTDVNATFVQPGVPGSGGTPLHIAVLANQIKAAELLLDKGAKVNTKAADAEQKGTALHWAAVMGRMNCVKLLIKRGANINAKDKNGYTPLDWAKHKLEGISDKTAVVEYIQKKGGKSGAIAPKKGKTEFRGSYFLNGKIYVNTYGTPEGKPLLVPPVKGQQDFKPSWSKTGDRLVFFRRVKNDPNVVNWKTILCTVKADGTDLQKLTDDTNTNFNPTWTRDGTNMPIWNRKNQEKGSFFVMRSKVGNKPGQEVAISDKSYHTWGHTCLKDGRILVEAAHPEKGWGYYLMKPKPGGGGRHERIDCSGLDRAGLLCRISLSPSEKKICFGHLLGRRFREPAHAIYIADFDVKKRAITNPRIIANKERKEQWYAYPRWNKDETQVVYHASGKLFIYTLKDGSTTQVSTKANADYRYPHFEDAPK